MASFEMQWEAPEFEYREKGVSWYWISIIVAAIVISFSVWQKNFLFGFFIVIAEMLFIVWGNRKPRMVHFSLNETAIVIDGAKHYFLKDLESFSVDELGGEWTELIFYSRAKLRTPLKLLLPQGHLEEFRAGIKNILKEIPYEPTLIDSIEKLLRF
jgi:hypothetical protein